MAKKLTLSLNENTIEEAKVYAKSNNTSLSKLIESYLFTLTQNNHVKPQITPLVNSLSGIIDIPEDMDFKTSYADYITNKYK